jgi:hypothetical protein
MQNYSDTVEEELFTEGITYYELPVPVLNPEPDRRKRSLLNQPVIPAGTRLRHVETRLRHVESPPTAGSPIVQRVLELVPNARQHWTDRYERVGAGRPRYTALMAVAVRVPATLAEWIRDEFPLLTDVGFVAQLVEARVLTIRDLRRHYTEWEAK